MLGSAAHLRAAYPAWEWRLPGEAAEEALLRTHSTPLVARVRAAAHDFDADTPAYENIFAHAARAAGAACAVAQASLGKTPAFSLMRPPGHHATRDQAMGFCFFNHIAIAALDALENGAERVAIWDFDAHHGNGTEAIVAGHPRIAFASVHQFPGYPGTGARSSGKVHNFPVAPFAPRAQHCDAVRRALDVLLEFQPDLLLVSAGFDAYAGDPITQMSLAMEDFALFGQWLRECALPAGAILEGGYSDDLPQLLGAFLSAWSSLARAFDCLLLLRPCPLEENQRAGEAGGNTRRQNSNFRGLELRGVAKRETGDEQRHRKPDATKHPNPENLTPGHSFWETRHPAADRDPGEEKNADRLAECEPANHSKAERTNECTPPPNATPALARAKRGMMACLIQGASACSKRNIGASA